MLQVVRTNHLPRAMFQFRGIAESQSICHRPYGNGTALIRGVVQSYLPVSVVQLLPMVVLVQCLPYVHNALQIPVLVLHTGMAYRKSSPRCLYWNQPIVV
jgi:hypothetical protein